MGDAEGAGDLEEVAVAGADVEEALRWWGGEGEEPAVVFGQGGGELSPVTHNKRLGVPGHV